MDFQTPDCFQSSLITAFKYFINNPNMFFHKPSSNLSQKYAEQQAHV